MKRVAMRLAAACRSNTELKMSLSGCTTSHPPHQPKPTPHQASTRNHRGSVRHLAAAAAAFPAIDTDDTDSDSLEQEHLPLPLSPPSQLTLGYACDNLSLRNSDRIFTNRSCIKRTFHARGLDHVSTLALQNCIDLLQIIEWNHQHGVHLFRVSSQLFPWSGQYQLEELQDFEQIAAALAEVGEVARRYGQRLTNHPPHFIKLASTDGELRLRSIADLEVQGRVFDLMGFPPSHENKINIHVGGTYGSKTRSLERFARTVESLSESVRLRLAVENDDRPNSYSVADLMELHTATGIPITFDFHHHQFCPGGQTQREAFESAIATWPSGIRPVVHWSETPECPDRQKAHPHAHSAFVYGPIDLYGREGEVDVMIESKAKEVALLLYRDEIAPRLVKAAV